jgi:hypothetical protein
MLRREDFIEGLRSAETARDVLSLIERTEAELG